MVFERIRKQLADAVPFAKYLGVELKEVTRGHAVALLPDRPELLNHIATQHAGALFALGETASGGAMAGAFAPIILEVRPVASEATIHYLKPARGAIEAEATLTGDPDLLMSELQSEGRVRFPVAVALRNAAGDKVAELEVQWHVSMKRPA